MRGRAVEDSLGMVRERRTVEVPADRSRLVFRGVAALSLPQSARIEGLPGRLLERNFDYDLEVSRCVLVVRERSRMAPVGYTAAPSVAGCALCFRSWTHAASSKPV